MNDIENKIKQVAETPRNDFETRYEQINDRLVAREPKQQRKPFVWKKCIAVMTTLVIIISAIITSVLLLKPDETRYLMTDINKIQSTETEFNTQIKNAKLDIIDTSQQSVNIYYLYESKTDNNIVGGYTEFSGTSNNDFYQVIIEIYSANVDFSTNDYIGYTSTHDLNGRTFYYKENGMEGPFNKISCYYTGDDFSMVVDYKGVTGDVWGLLNLLIKTN